MVISKNMNKYIIVLISLSLGCGRYTQNLENQFLLNEKIAFQNTDCLELFNSLDHEYNATHDRSLTCCLIDCASKGNKSCEEIIISRINNYDKKYSKGYVSCFKHKTRGICTKKIFEAQLHYIEQNQHIFECTSNNHGGFYCKGSGVVSSLYFGLIALQKGEEYKNHDDIIKKFPPSESETNDILYNDTCGCKISKATFYAIKELFRNGELDLLEYASISSDSIR